MVNNGGSSITLDGSGAQTIDGEDSITIPAGRGLELNTDGSNWISKGRNFEAANPVPRPQGYLTLVSGSPVITSDQEDKTAVYYALDKGDLIPIWNGDRLVTTTFTEKTLTLNAAHASNSIYDVFLWLEDGTLTIGTGPVWSTITAGSGARGTGDGTTELIRKSGVFVNNVAMTARNGATTYSVGANLATYVGSIFIDSTAGQITCHTSVGQSRKWGVWNAYNRRPIQLRVTDPTTTWTYGTNTRRASNNDSNNSLTVFSGLAEETANLRFKQHFGRASNTDVQIEANISMSVNSVTVPTGSRGRFFQDGAGSVDIAVQGSHVAENDLLPTLGTNVITALETANSGSTVNWYGTEIDMLMKANWRG